MYEGECEGERGIKACENVTVCKGVSGESESVCEMVSDCKRKRREEKREREKETRNLPLSE